ncbi:FUSC family protein [Francisella philomiragia]|uniref:Fusaric acid resistance family protein n=1 Tax=Francisella philomiragia TaxID=28110 RepID=A0A0B6CR89_9GAMM|nr:FUSC family protein [Francisella philomiragia]AJI52964.1 fusaric acid resistance family protein [Francisella philomiragia]
MIQKIFDELPTIINKENAIYTIKGCISLTLALYISMSLNLDKPMWAMISALFLQTRPETGFIIEKALLLIAVSFIGVFVGFLIVTFFLPFPVLALIALCTFISISIFFSANMSHPNFIYALALANVTCIIIVFYSIANPNLTTEETIFHTGFSRVTEISIGCICSCFVNYYIFPVKIQKTLKNHSHKVLNLTTAYIQEMFSTQDFINNQKYNLKVEGILNSLVALDNDLSAAKYENLDKSSYLIFSNAVVELIEAIHSLRKSLAKTKNIPTLQNHLKTIASSLNNIDSLNDNLKIITDNQKLTKVITKLINLISSYKNLELVSNEDDIAYSFIRYTNPIVTLIATARTVSLLLVMYYIWVSTDGNSSLLMMIILPCVLSQLFISAPNPTDAIGKNIIGIIISIPISIFITLNLLSQAVGYFELLILILLIVLFIPIVTLNVPKLQMYSLGFYLGFVSMVQPSNHMSFEITSSFTIAMSSIVGCTGLWLAFKLFPLTPYTLSRKVAIKSIIKDTQKLKKHEISKEYYQASLIKKILSVYRNRKDDQSSERDIEFALQSLTKCY